MVEVVIGLASASRGPVSGGPHIEGGGVRADSSDVHISARVYRRGCAEKYIVVYTRQAQFASSSDSYLSAPRLTGCLLLIDVGEFETAEQRDEDGVVHRLYAPFGKLEHARRILDVGPALG